ncbi:uncharacterized protein LOC121376762 [Gigantopelta aegis]|uniref:uncharacterized protein LOC121376762 n=1 Tax=Gigantopelta aegis TaxID=1735272 RepID=UPI001B889302|nr:uncharacterized protein LOC121376762 [Gigantopelta aegis]
MTRSFLTVYDPASKDGTCGLVADTGGKRRPEDCKRSDDDVAMTPPPHLVRNMVPLSETSSILQPLTNEDTGKNSTSAQSAVDGAQSNSPPCKVPTLSDQHLTCDTSTNNHYSDKHYESQKQFSVSTSADVSLHSASDAGSLLTDTLLVQNDNTLKCSGRQQQHCISATLVAINQHSVSSTGNLITDTSLIQSDNTQSDNGTAPPCDATMKTRTVSNFTRDVHCVKDTDMTITHPSPFSTPLCPRRTKDSASKADTNLSPFHFSPSPKRTKGPLSEKDTHLLPFCFSPSPKRAKGDVSKVDIHPSPSRKTASISKDCPMLQSDTCTSDVGSKHLLISGKSESSDQLTKKLKSDVIQSSESQVINSCPPLTSSSTEVCISSSFTVPATKNIGFISHVKKLATATGRISASKLDVSKEKTSGGLKTMRESFLLADSSHPQQKVRVVQVSRSPRRRQFPSVMMSSVAAVSRTITPAGTSIAGKSNNTQRNLSTTPKGILKDPELKTQQQTKSVSFSGPLQSSKMLSNVTGDSVVRQHRQQSTVEGEKLLFSDSDDDNDDDFVSQCPNTTSSDKLNKTNKRRHEKYF